jgi:hypothetical protein
VNSGFAGREEVSKFTEWGADTNSADFLVWALRLERAATMARKAG